MLGVKKLMLRDTDKKVQSSKNTWHSNSNASCCPSLNSLNARTLSVAICFVFFFWQGRREGKGRAGPIPLRDRKEPLIRQQIFQSNFNITFVHTSTGVIHVKINLHLDCIQRWRLWVQQSIYTQLLPKQICCNISVKTEIHRGMDTCPK